MNNEDELLRQAYQNLLVRVAALEREIQVLKSKDSDINGITDWVNFRISPQYQELSAEFREMGFTRKAIDKAMAIAYRSGIPYDNMRERVLKQLSTQSLFQE